MAYADQQVSTRKVVSLSLVVLLHLLIGYAFISGLAFNVIKKVNDDLKTFDVDEEPPPPPDKPPPPPEVPKQIEPPPVVTPPPVVQTQSNNAPIIQVVPVAPPPVITPQAPPAPPPPPRPVISQAAAAKGNPGSWVTPDDYPASALRDGLSGRSTLTFNINALGKIENCRVTGTSGSPVLDDAACKLVTRRGRYTPAKDTAGQATAGGSKTLTFTWRLPE